MKLKEQIKDLSIKSTQLELKSINNTSQYDRAYNYMYIQITVYIQLL